MEEQDEKPFENPNFLKIEDRERWFEFMRASNKYEKTIVSYANHLAIAIQNKINDGLILEDAIKLSLRETKEMFSLKGEHISSLMIGKAIKILSEVWVWPYSQKLLEFYTVFYRENPLLN